MTRSKSAGVFLYKTRPYRFLFVQSYGKKYGPAKGHYSDTETMPEQCAARELAEETGVSLSPEYIASFRRTRIGQTYIYYVPLPDDFDWNVDWSRLDKEVTDMQWMSPHEVTVELNHIGRESLKKFQAQCRREEAPKIEL